jgi:hypothetical protein
MPSKPVRLSPVPVAAGAAAGAATVTVCVPTTAPVELVAVSV